jgi:hypothetical protein
MSDTNEEKERIRRGFELLINHCNPSSVYGGMITPAHKEGVSIYDYSATFLDAEFIRVVGPVGGTSSIAALCMNLQRELTEAAEIGFLKGVSGSVWPFYVTSYKEMVLCTGCSWNSGEGGRGYREMQAVFLFLSHLYGYTVHTLEMDEATENRYMEYIRLAQADQ